MKNLVKVFPVFKIIPALLASILIYYFLKAYLFTTFQKSYLTLVSGLLFCFYLYYMEVIRQYPSFNVGRYLKPGLSIVNLILAILLLVFLYFGIKLGHAIIAKANQFEASHDNLYTIISLSASYQRFGLIKRGLMPTLVNFASSKYNIQIYCAKLFGTIIFIGGIAAVAISKQFSKFSRKIFLGIFLLAPAGIYCQFKFTGGAYDMAMIGFFFFATALNKKPASLIFDVAGVLTHEAYLFLRLPFLLFNLYCCFTDKGKVKKPFAFEVVNLAVLCISFLLMSSNWVRPELAVLKSSYFLHYPNLPAPTAGDFHAFNPISKDVTFGYQMNLMHEYHQSKEFYTYSIPLFVCIIAMGLLSYFFSNLKGRQKAMDIFCSGITFLTPLLLSFIGTDIGRWLNFGFISWACYYVLFRSVLFPDSKLSENCLYVMLLILLVFTPLGIFEQPLMSVLMK